MKIKRRASSECLKFIQDSHRCMEWSEAKQAYMAYPDISGITRIGWGHRVHYVDIKCGMLEEGLSKHGTELLFLQDIRPIEDFINRKQEELGSIDQREFDALVEIGYDVGIGAIEILLFAWQECMDMASVFMMFVYDDRGRVVTDMIQRRAQDIRWWTGKEPTEYQMRVR